MMVWLFWASERTLKLWSSSNLFVTFPLYSIVQERVMLSLVLLASVASVKLGLHHLCITEGIYVYLLAWGDGTPDG